MKKSKQDYINENRKLRKYNYELSIENNDLQKEINKLNDKLSEANATISKYKDELLNTLVKLEEEKRKS